MGNHYLNTSFVVDFDTDTQATVAVAVFNMLNHAEDIGMAEVAKDSHNPLALRIAQSLVDEEAIPVYQGVPERIHLHIEVDQDDHSGKRVWIRDDGETISLDATGLVLQRLLDEFKIDRSIRIYWAATADRPYLDAFGGGAMLVSRKMILSKNTNEAMDDMQQAFERKIAAQAKNKLDQQRYEDADAFWRECDFACVSPLVPLDSDGWEYIDPGNTWTKNIYFEDTARESSPTVVGKILIDFQYNSNEIASASLSLHGEIYDLTEQLNIPAPTP